MCTDQQSVYGALGEEDWGGLLDAFAEYGRRPDSPLIVRFHGAMPQPGAQASLALHDIQDSPLPLGRNDWGLNTFSVPASQVISLGVESESMWEALQIAYFMFEAWQREHGGSYRFTGGMSVAVYQWHRPAWWGPRLHCVERSIRPLATTLDGEFDETEGSLIW